MASSAPDPTNGGRIMLGAIVFQLCKHLPIAEGSGAVP